MTDQQQQQNQVVMKSTTTHGYLYEVFKKGDIERKKVLYTGEVSDDPLHNYCECAGWAMLSKCYHHQRATQITKEEEK